MSFKSSSVSRLVDTVLQTLQQPGQETGSKRVRKWFAILRLPVPNGKKGVPLEVPQNFRMEFPENCWTIWFFLENSEIFRQMVSTLCFHSRKLNRYGKSKSQNRLEWGTLSSRNQPEMALYRTLPDLPFSHLQWDGGTRLPIGSCARAFSRDCTSLLQILIGSLSCPGLLWLVTVITFVLVLRHSTENRCTRSAYFGPRYKKQGVFLGFLGDQKIFRNVGDLHINRILRDL